MDKILAGVHHTAVRIIVVGKSKVEHLDLLGEVLTSQHESKVHDFANRCNTLEMALTIWDSPAKECIVTHKT